ncbi:hypothetical protein [Pseudomonas putida]|uniref:Uncharacterized protein n=1 Tax=Pseudomonas putida TaxID=303 RepID=A0A8I1EAB4_PSEPU|nr:hypothetical protein [Pseudomonas putida]MBI6882749.1 hypothetical protein [Pseudomonas putida]
MIEKKWDFYEKIDDLEDRARWFQMVGEHFRKLFIVLVGTVVVAAIVLLALIVSLHFAPDGMQDQLKLWSVFLVIAGGISIPVCVLLWEIAGSLKDRARDLHLQASQIKLTGCSTLTRVTTWEWT